MPIGARILRNRFVDGIESLAVVQVLLIYFQDVYVWRFIVHLVLIHGPLSPVIRARRMPVENIQHRGALLMVFGAFFWGLLAHVRWPLPDAGSRVDGRLHGSLFTEFIGSLPVTRPWIVAWDVVLLLLELAMFASTYNELLVLREATIAGEVFPYGPEPSTADIYSGCSVVYAIDLWDTLRRNWQLQVSTPSHPRSSPPSTPSSSPEIID